MVQVLERRITFPQYPFSSFSLLFLLDFDAINELVLLSDLRCMTLGMVSWNLWHRLTHYRKWQEPKGETLDGTNNASERAISWWIKKRYRTMRGYKVPENTLRVSRLLAWCGNFLNTEDG